MDAITLWHNPRCSKSRQALALLRDQGVEPVVFEYLKHAPTEVELDRVLNLLGLEPRQLMRQGETAYTAAGLDDPTLQRAALVAAMAAQPILIERPVAIRGDRAVLGRPPEHVLDLLTGGA